MNDLPLHVGIIMDGNSRWALRNHLPKISGYKKGAEVAMEVVLCSLSHNIKYLTLYAFSTENWQRNKFELQGLFSLFVTYFNEYVEQLFAKGIAINFIGDSVSFPDEVKCLIDSTRHRSLVNAKCTVNVAMGYGSRYEILEAVKKIILLKKNIDELNSDFFSSLLYMPGVPDPDLIIRTGGEKRLSNFLLWQSAYSELYFCDIMWPDFSSKNFAEALDEYGMRVRRYGK